MISLSWTFDNFSFFWFSSFFMLPAQAEVC